MQHGSTSTSTRKEAGKQSPVVHVQGIRKSYRTGNLTTPVLHGIDLQVEQGECLFLMGPSGSGKSTLLSILGCILSPDEGELKILGEDVTYFRPQQQARFRRERIGFIFQQFHLFNGLTAQENVGVVFDLLGTSKRIAKRESLQLLELVGLADRARYAISQLSMGQRQRVAIARAMAANPDLILADEPTSSLDAESGQNAMKIIKGLCRQLNKTAIIVTHDTRIIPMADRVLYLEDGRIKNSGPSEKNTQTVKQDPDLELSEITGTFRTIEEQIKTL